MKKNQDGKVIDLPNSYGDFFNLLMRLWNVVFFVIQLRKSCKTALITKSQEF